MSDRQYIIVPQVSSYPGSQARARKILRWLTGLGIVELQLSACGMRPGALGYAMAPGAERVLDLPAGVSLPLDQPRTGLEIVTERCIFTPERDFEKQAGCPQCRREIGEALFEHLEAWMPGETDNFECPECGFEDDINGFIFPQPCAFSDLGFIFNNWPGEYFLHAFLDEFRERLGFPIRVVRVRLQEDPAQR
ncbi:sugar ABC transporter ATPase [Stutzerimonas nitrititolerans]|uniref:sugar ABC transporter ATPase n=1 Tax=Stutzerimonas nitrititolerans TaxID=2482751 RepID=UPI00289C7BC2|nr:sugar ABC transporter ATPase [Stutzerimonas nitrititolerans]